MEPLLIEPLLEPVAEPELLELDPAPPSLHPLSSTLCAVSTGLMLAAGAKESAASTPPPFAGMRRLCRVTQADAGVRPESASARSSAPGPQRRVEGST